jgi:hypothetical protein
MPSATQLSTEDRFVGLFVGRSGSGKTPAACSFPGPIEVLDFDQRIRGLLGCSWVDLTKINYDVFPPRESGGVTRLNKKLEGWMVAASVGQLHVKTIVLDSLTAMCQCLIQQALPITHAGGKGMSFGTINLTGPEDYKFESQGTLSVLSFLRSLPGVNIIVTAHLVPRWGKLPGANAFSENVQIGEKLSITDKLGENCLIYFDHIFRFDAPQNGQKHLVQFRGDMARTGFGSLPNGDHDITNTAFYPFMQSKLSSAGRSPLTDLQTSQQLTK